MPDWFFLAAIGLLAVGGFVVTRSQRDIERRLSALEMIASVQADSARRAHVRLDNQQRQLEALAKQLGWTDDRALTTAMTAPLSPVKPKSVTP